MQVRYNQSGYVESSRSVRAAAAERAGLLPLARAARAAGVSPARVAAHIEPAEWHHVGKYATRTDFYDVEEIRSRFGLGGDLEHASAPKKTASVEYDDRTVEWVESVQSGRYSRRRVEHREEGCQVVIGGKTATITLPNGETLTKRLTTKGFSHYPRGGTPQDQHLTAAELKQQQQAINAVIKRFRQAAKGFRFEQTDYFSWRDTHHRHSDAATWTPITHQHIIDTLKTATRDDNGGLFYARRAVERLETRERDVIRIGLNLAIRHKIEAVPANRTAKN